LTFQPMHLLIIAGIALLISGLKRLAELGKGLGDGSRGFNAAMNPDAGKPGEPKTPALKKPKLIQNQNSGGVESPARSAALWQWESCAALASNSSDRATLVMTGDHWEFVK
jgi:sec-independent protein translocase protein TatA